MKAISSDLENSTHLWNLLLQNVEGVRLLLQKCTIKLQTGETLKSSIIAQKLSKIYSVGQQLYKFEHHTLQFQKKIIVKKTQLQKQVNQIKEENEKLYDTVMSLTADKTALDEQLKKKTLKIKDLECQIKFDTSFIFDGNNVEDEGQISEEMMEEEDDSVISESDLNVYESLEKSIKNEKKSQFMNLLDNLKKIEKDSDNENEEIY